jgi:hypothetical protein
MSLLHASPIPQKLGRIKPEPLTVKTNQKRLDSPKGQWYQFKTEKKKKAVIPILVIPISQVRGLAGEKDV